MILCLKIPAGDGLEVLFWIEPQKIGPIPIQVKAQSTQAADALRRTLLVEVTISCLCMLSIIYTWWNEVLILIIPVSKETRTFFKNNSYNQRKQVWVLIWKFYCEIKFICFIVNLPWLTTFEESLLLIK